MTTINIQRKYSTATIECSKGYIRFHDGQIADAYEALRDEYMNDVRHWKDESLVEQHWDIVRCVRDMGRNVGVLINKHGRVVFSGIILDKPNRAKGNIMTNQFHNMTKKALVSIAAEYGCKSLVSVETDAKTVKGSKLGYRTAIVYMQPDMILCPMSKEAGCHEPCLVTSGLASVYDTIANARKGRTAFFHGNRDAFMALLKRELDAFIRKAHKDNFVPVIRLNGTSDIDYTAIEFHEGLNVFEYYSDTQFYDYSKKPSHARKAQKYANYHITLSYSAASAKYADATIQAAKKYNANIAVVFDGKDYPAVWHGMPVVNGDDSDLRFKDGTGKVVALYAKGKAKQDTSGFVQSTSIIAKG